MRNRLFEAAAAVLVGLFFVNAGSLSISVSQPYLRLIPGVTAAGYLHITNDARAPLPLNGAQSFA